MIANPHRREDCRYRHRGTHGYGQSSTTPVVLRIIHDISRHTSKGYRQPGEIHRVGITGRKMAKKFHQVLTFDQTTFLGGMPLQRKRFTEDIGILSFPFVQILRTVFGTVAKQEFPILFADNGVKLRGIPSTGIESANDRSHGCSCNDIDRNPCSFYHLQHTDMGHAFRTAT